jgi:hypothetical protein
MKLRVDLEKLHPDGGYVDTRRWFDQYERYIQLQCETKTDDQKEENRSKIYLRYLPLFLAGSALICWEELPEAEKQDYEVVKKRLRSYYELDESQAYTMFVTGKYTGEGVDVFVATLRRYLSTMSITGEIADKLILQQFLQAIPATVATELRTRCSKEGTLLGLHVVLSTARTLPALQLGAIIGGVPGNPKKDRPKRAPEAKPNNPEGGKGKEYGGKPRSCFLCGDPHLMKECPLVRNMLGNMSGNGADPQQSAASAGPQKPAAKTYPQ